MALDGVCSVCVETRRHVGGNAHGGVGVDAARSAYGVSYPLCSKLCPSRTVRGRVIFAS